jgi:hypothetical protein
MATDIDKIYQEELGRNADPSGRAAYAGMSDEDIRRAIRESPEYKGRSSSGGDSDSSGGSGRSASGASGLSPPGTYETGDLFDDPEHEISLNGNPEDEDSPTITYQNLDHMYMDVLGRHVTEDDLAWVDNQTSEQQILRGLVTSAEARQRGVDPNNYGIETVDPETLSDEQRQYNDLYRDTYGVNMTQWELDNWVDHGTIEAFESSLNGEITYLDTPLEGGGYQHAAVYSQAALDRTGGVFTGDGDDPGQIVILPEGTEVAGENWEQVDSGDGYIALVATGNPSGGIWEDLGFKADDLPDWVWAGVDYVAPVLLAPSTFGASLYFTGQGAELLGGQQGHAAAGDFYTDALGWEDLDRDLNMITSAAITTMATIAGYAVGGPPGAALFAGGASVGRQVSTAIAMDLGGYEVDWGDVAENAAWTMGTAALTAVNPLLGATASAVRVKTDGGTWGQAGAEFGWSWLSGQAGGMVPGGSYMVDAARLWLDDDYSGRDFMSDALGHYLQGALESRYPEFSAPKYDTSNDYFSPYQDLSGRPTSDRVLAPLYPSADFGERPYLDDDLDYLARTSDYVV